MAFALGGGGGLDFNPRSVSLGQAQTNGIPYINAGGGLPTPFIRNTHTPPRIINFGGGPVPAPPGSGDQPAGGTTPVSMNGSPAQATVPADQTPPPNVLSAESVRATGAGP